MSPWVAYVVYPVTEVVEVAKLDMCISDACV